MLQEISKWIWGNNIDYNNLKLGRRYAACKIENTYLNYKSRNRISELQKETIKNILIDIRIKRRKPIKNITYNQ